MDTQRKHPLAKCKVDGCDNKKHAGEMCSKHYTRLVRYGNPHYVNPNRAPRLSKNATMEERFWAKVSIVDDENSCWPWTASIGKETGYGRFSVGNGVVKDAHVVSFELENGPVPIGKELDHTCRYKPCVRPKHLEAVTHKENMWRSPIWNGNKTHCTNGHEYTKENTRMHHGRRECRRCCNERRKKYPDYGKYSYQKRST